MAKTIRIEQAYRFTPAQVWEALTDATCLSAWLMTTDFEPVVGRKFQFRADPQPGWKGIVDGVVLDVVPLERLVYEWRGSPTAKPTVVTWTLAANGTGTTLVLEQTGFEGVGGWFLRMMMAKGWEKKLRSEGMPEVLAAVAQGKAGELQPRFPRARLSRTSA